MAAPVRVKVAASGAGQVRKEVTSINRILGTIGVGAGALLTAAAVQGTKAFTELDTVARRVLQVVDDKSEDNVERVREQILEIARDTGQPVQDIGDAMYDSISSTIVKTQDEASDYVGAVARAATAGSADIQTAMDFATSATNAFNLEAGDLERVMDSASGAIAAGKTDLTQLGQSYSQVAPQANSLGVSMEDVNAQLATLTLSGTTTATAANQMRRQFTELSDHTKAGLGQTFFELTGKTFPDFIAEGGRVNEALNVIAEHAVATNTPITVLASSSEAANAVIGATGVNAGKFTTAMTTIDESAGLTSENFELMQRGMRQQMDETQESMNALMTKIGELVAKLLDEGGLLAAFEKIVNYLTENEGALWIVLAALGTMFAVTLVTKVAAFTSTIAAIGPQVATMAPKVSAGLASMFAAIGPAGWIALAVAALAAGLIILEQRYGRVITKADTLAASEGRIEGAVDDPHRGAGRSGISLGRDQTETTELAGWMHVGSRHRRAQQERSAQADAARWAAAAAANTQTRRGNIANPMGSLPGMQAGGIVTGPTVAMIGEGGADEAVIPLPSNWRQRGMGGTTNITINVDNTLGGGVEAGEKVVEVLTDFFQRNPGLNMQWAN